MKHVYALAVQVPFFIALHEAWVGHTQRAAAFGGVLVGMLAAVPALSRLTRR